MPDSKRAEFRARCDAIEEAYEFQIAYAAQGLDGTEGSPNAGELRRLLDGAERAVTGLGRACAAVVETERHEPAELYRSFIDVVERDAEKAGAAVRLVLAQPTISSQLIDNLNASIHIRTLLTDLFVLDEVFKRQAPASASPPAS